jgi:hypothetical protein
MSFNNAYVLPCNFPDTVWIEKLDNTSTSQNANTKVQTQSKIKLKWARG